MFIDSRKRREAVEVHAILSVAHLNVAHTHGSRISVRDYYRFRHRDQPKWVPKPSCMSDLTEIFTA